ncbi:MAG: zinc-ribbon domain-containing protein [Pseudomonadota bacterium]
MRLICPNCDAQYEVPAEVIPTEGRDVQCSSCGQTWFQHHPDHPPLPEPEDEVDPPAEGETRVPAPEPAPAPQQRQLDPNVADILRQEAEQEQRARAAEALESQPDLGLDDLGEAPPPAPDAEDDATKRAREARARMARLRGEPEEPEATAAPGSRRDLLPDIEEINSTLRSASDRAPGPQADAAAPVAQTRQRSFRRGFATSVIVAALATGLYAAAPRISAEVPSAAPALRAYTSQVDGARLWLDGQWTRMLQWLDSASA